MIISGLNILTECSECKKGFDPSKDYDDMKNESDHILCWCRKCHNHYNRRVLIKKGFKREVANKIMKEAIDECTETIDYETAIETLAISYLNKRS